MGTVLKNEHTYSRKFSKVKLPRAVNIQYYERPWLATTVGVEAPKSDDIHGTTEVCILGLSTQNGVI